MESINVDLNLEDKILRLGRDTLRLDSSLTSAQASEGLYPNEYALTLHYLSKDNVFMDNESYKIKAFLREKRLLSANREGEGIFVDSTAYSDEQPCPNLILIGQLKLTIRS